MMGLGSILGTGVFVSVGIAAGIAGPAVVVAVALGAVVAFFNGLSSAQLAANHPVSGGTYEYGYRYLRPWLGFTAGWMFLSAKSASAATAALGLAGYVLHAFGHSGNGSQVAVAWGAIVFISAVVAGGIRRSNRINAAIVGFTLLSLCAFILAGLLSEPAGAHARGGSNSASDIDGPSLLHATALMFVAYTGYGRIATLGEEVKEPGRTIPRAIIATLVITMVLYALVAWVAVATVGAPRVAEATRSAGAPLATVAGRFATPGVSWLVAAGAITAMASVLLNLVLGLSRVLLAMSRRGDMPPGLARLSGDPASPRRAVAAVAFIIGVMALPGSVTVAWSFSAFTVLVYYALTNLAALYLPTEQRLYPRWLAMAGLAACSGLAFWVEPAIWGAGVVLIFVGLGWHFAAQR